MKRYQRRFTAEGLNMERLICQAGARGICLKQLRRRGRKISGVVEEQAWPALCAMADQGGWRLDAGPRVGLGRWVDGLRRRVVLVLGVGLALLAVAAASQLMWRIDVVDGGLYEADIRQYLTEQGIVPLRWRAQVDASALRDALEWRYPEVAWIETGWRGVALQIRVAEGTPAGETLSTQGACDVIALRDGIVTGVVTVAGTPMVQAGEIVRKGQVLIAGSERTAQGETRAVAARGHVMARVWDAAGVRMSVWERETVYTGKVYQTWTVALPWFDLWREKASGYEQEDVSVRVQCLGGAFLPLTIRSQTHYEAHVTLQKRDMEVLKGEAGVAAMRKLRQKIGRNDDLVDKWVEFSMIEGEQVCAVAYGERVIDIAQQNRGTAQ